MSESDDRLSALTPAERDELLRRLAGRTGSAGSFEDAIVRRDFTDEAPVSRDQRFWWLLQSLNPRSSAYHMPLVVKLRGELQESALRASFDALLDRHEILRTVYPRRSDGPIQKILPPPPTFHWVFYDLADAEDPVKEARALVQQRIAEPFDLETDLPFRIVLIRLAKDEHVIASVFHHIAADAWTSRLLLNELREEYEARLQGRPSQGLRPSIRFADFAAWELEQLEHPHFARGIEFWRGHLRGAKTGVDWPSPSVPAGQLPSPGHLRRRWPKATVDKLKAYAAERKTTSFSVIHLSFAAFMATYMGEEDLTVGVPIAKRHRRELQDLIGCLINTVPLRSQLKWGVTFDEWVAQGKQTWTDVVRHQWIPLETIIRELYTDRHTDPAALFDILLTYFPGDPLERFGNLDIEAFDYGAQAMPRVPLDVTVHDAADSFDVEFDYDASRIPRPVAEALSEAWPRFAEACIKAPAAPIWQHRQWESDQHGTLIDELAHGPRYEVEDAAAHELLAKWAEQDANRTALVFDGGQWTYEELNQRANAVARSLRARGVGAESRVGVSLERSPELVAALFGVLKAGAAYVALAPELPAKRLEYMALDSGILHVICDEAGARATDGLHAIRQLRIHALDDCAPDGDETSVDAENLAYILYTSGTTGLPKGVAISHGALSNLVQMRDVEDVRAADFPARRFVLGSQYTFDMSVAQIFIPLCNGASLAVPRPDLERNPQPFAEWLERTDVTDVELTPTNLQILTEARTTTGRSSVRRVHTGGEALNGSLCGSLFQLWGDVRIRNLYGPTEMCNAQVAKAITTATALQPSVPIGRPCPNHSAFLVEATGSLVPLHQRGELCLAGAGEARGYFGKPRLTAAAFVPCPYSDEPGRRMYRTGDLARWRPDGELDYDGRADAQVQVRGVRIELGEIEAQLERIGGIKRAAVRPLDLRNGRADSLVAYVVFEQDSEISVQSLRQHLSDHLAQAVIPSFFVELPALPVTASGKVDRNALPAPETQLRNRERTAPRNDLERTLAGIWADILEVEEVGIHENFFEIGGHSLFAVRIQGKISEAFGVVVPLQHLFESPTIAELAHAIDALEAGDSQRIQKHSYVDTAPLSAEQRRMWFLHCLEPGSTAYHVPLVDRLRGPLDVEALKTAAQALVDRHEILRTVIHETPEGPVQSIRPSGEALSWAYLDVSGEDDADGSALELVQSRIRTPFDLSRETPLRVTLIRTAEAEHLLLVLFHHIAIDEWTTGVAVSELRELYEAELESREYHLGELPIQYADYAIWQNERLAGSDLEGSADFWKAHLDRAPDRVDWPMGEEPASDQHPTGVVRLSWSRDEQIRFQDLAKTHGTTLFSMHFALFTAFLARFTGQSDFTVGVPVTTRERAELQGVVGFLLNTVPIRSQVLGDASFHEWLARSQATWRSSVPHQWLPLEEIVAATGSRPGSFGLPLFDVVFTYLPIGALEGTLGEARTESVHLDGPTDAKTTLSVYLRDSERGLEATLEYDAARFELADVQQLGDQFRRFTRKIAENPAARIFAVDLLADHEVAAIAQVSRGAFFEEPRVPFHRLFETTVQRHPHGIAVRTDEKQWTYEELDGYANAVAHGLSRRGVTAGARVGICMQRSADLVAALIGTLKAGGTYVALEPSLPAQRLAYMADDAGVDLVVCDSLGRNVLTSDSITLLPIDELLAKAPLHGAPTVEVELENLAYILYTSGTTGRPKGVMIPHRALAGVSTSYAALYGLEQSVAVGVRNVLVKAAYTFDLFVGELFPALSCGATVSLAPVGSEKAPAELASFAKRHNVTDILATPTSLRLLLEGGDFDRNSSVEFVTAGGEALTEELATTLRERWGGRLWNFYGPTEMCCGQTYYEVTDHGGRGVVSIGTATPGHVVSIMDSYAGQRATGIDGEIVICGFGEAWGYCNMPRRTAQTFLPGLSQARGARSYTTGDVGRWSEHGTISYRGRRDEQVQIRGVRVELPEIEAHLESVPGVRQAAVRPIGVVAGRADQLVGYVVLEPGATLDAPSIKTHLSMYLHEGAVPGTIVALDTLPRNASGKVDRHALPKPELNAVSDHFTAPRTPTERALADIWSHVLGLPQVGVHQNFFDIGGHSLLAVRVQAAISRELGVQIPLRKLFEVATIAGLGILVEGGEQESAPAIQRHEYGDTAPLSAEQRRMWFLHRMEPDSTAYHVPLVYDVVGTLDYAALKSAVQKLTDRHESLRTTIEEDALGPRQRILPPGQSVPWKLVDVSEHDQPCEAARRLIAGEMATPFDLEHELPLRIVVAHAENDHDVLLVLFHHIAIDEWTTGVAVAELLELYEAEVESRPHLLPELGIQYADYAIWQNERLAGPELQESLAFWKNHLEEAHGEIEWPIGEKSTAEKHLAGAVGFSWSVEQSEQIRAFARERRVTVFTALHAVFSAFMARFTGQRDLTIGIPVTMRERAELQGLVGFLLNTVPFRSRVPAGASFARWLKETSDDWRDTTRHHWVPLEEIVTATGATRKNHGPPLFDVMFTYVPGGEVSGFGTAEMRLLDVGGVAEAKAALIGFVREDEERLTLQLEYDTSRFHSREMERVADAFRAFVRSCFERPDTPMEGHELVESEVLLDNWSRGMSVEVAPTTVHELFEEQARRSPDAVALISGAQQWTYKELDSRANRLAHRLRAHRVGPDTRVGVHVQRSPELIMTFLGVMKAGGAYVPLEPHEPQNRLSYIAEDAGVRVIVTDQSAEHSWKGVVLSLQEAPGEAVPDTPPEVEVTPDNLCYVLYTSGSTGRPKGVMIPHGAVVNHSLWRQAEFGLNRSDVALLKSPASFDASVLEIFPILHAGGTLVCTKPLGERDAPHMADLVRSCGVTTMFAVPVQLEELLRQPAFVAATKLKRVFCGGEAWGADLRERFFTAFPDVQLFNAYGPTEATIYATTWPCVSDRSSPAHPIGKPVGNYLIHVLDPGLQRGPIGSNGELCVAGPGLARGYQAMARRTAEAFVPHPFGDVRGDRMYRTGDIVRWNESGEIEYRSRRDHQVQLQGVRTELPEVEAALSRAPGVRLAAVKVVTLGNVKVLAAYLVAEGDTFALREVQDFVNDELPGPMVPKFWEVLDDMPLTSSGKIDRKALPEHGHGASSSNGKTEPRDDIERVIAEVWCEQLGLEEVGVHENFFELGGHSLMAARIGAALRDALSFEVPLRQLFEFPTVAELATYVKTSQVGQQRRVERHEYGETAPLSADQKRMWFLQQLQPDSSAYHVPLAVRFRGPLDTEALRAATRQLVDRHEVLRTIYPETSEGPIQRILPRGQDVAWELLDLRKEADPSERALSEIRARIATPFDLLHEVPLRVTLVQDGDDSYVALLLFHHIAIDEWTTGVAVAELRELYEAEIDRRDDRLLPLPIQYADYAIWQSERLHSDELHASLEYWINSLAGAADQLEWPIGEEPTTDAHPAAIAEFAWTESQSERIRLLAREHGTTVFATLHALFSAFLARYTGQRDLTVGVPATTRERGNLQSLVGFLLNTVPIRSIVPADASFEEWLAQSLANWRASTAHHWVPLETIVAATGARRTEHGLPLFDVMFTYLPGRDFTGEFGGLELSAYDYGGLTQAKTRLVASVFEDGNNLAGTFEYDAARFPAPKIEELVEQFARFVVHATQEPSTPLWSITLVDEPTRRSLETWATGPSFAAPRCFPPMFEEVVRSYPDRLAVRDDAVSWTYQELNRLANLVAHRLIAEGVRLETPVGIAVERSAELVAALLGTLKSGGTYVALEPSLPEERIAYMSQDAGVEIVVTDAASQSRLSGSSVRVLVIEELLGDSRALENPGLNIDAEHLAYILYTSGTTGYPKGVMIPHRALAGVASSYAAIHEFGANCDRIRPTVLIKSSYTFDMFVSELFPSLSVGATVAVAPSGSERNPRALSSFVRNHGVTDLWATPSALRLLLDDGDLDTDSPLRVVSSGGEALTAELATAIRERWRVRLWNFYGPTEMCVAQTCCDVEEGWRGVASIGAPTPGHFVTILDHCADPRATETDGHIVIRGFGEARGYGNMPRRTAQTFLPAPGGALGARMYFTGDIGRWSDKGTILYRGRSDDQLQIRGVRVELAEVEAHLQTAPGVARGAVRAMNIVAGRADVLIAYVVIDDGVALNTAAIAEHLSRRLPDAAVPNVFVELESLPQNASGKVDRNALPDPGRAMAPAGLTRPRDTTEAKIAQIWCDALNLPEVGVYQDFFALGGHSLLAVGVQRRIREALGVELPVESFFRFATVDKLASLVRLVRDGAVADDASNGPAAILQPGNPGRTPVVIIHPIGGNLLGYRALVDALDSETPVIGVRSASRKEGQPRPATIEQLATLYLGAVQEATASVGAESCILVGWSFGGVVAYEMARQMTLAGRRPQGLFLIDAWSSAHGGRGSKLAPFEHFVVDLAATLNLPITDEGGGEALREMQPEDRFRWLAEQMSARGVPGILTADQLEALFDAFEAHLAAYNSYTPGRLDASLTLFPAAAEGGPPDRGWGDLAASVRLMPLDTHHYGIVRSPHVDTIASEIAAVADPIVARVPTPGQT